MRIERVDDRTVKCFLSNEELEEYDIDYKDFVLRSEKAREVVQEIIEQAEEKVGYRPPRFAFDLQIMMLPDQGLLLTFSEKDPELRDGEQLIECLKEMKRVLQRTKERVGMIDTAEARPGEEIQQQAGGETGKKRGRPKQEKIQRPDFAVFSFSNLGNVMNYAAALPSNLRMESKLYEVKGVYYLFLWKGHTSYDRYSKVCIQALEFGDLCTADESKTAPLVEHGTCLIAEKAVKKLKG